MSHPGALIFPDGKPPGGQPVEFVSLDSELIPKKYRPTNPFAYRLAQEGARHVSEVLRPGDCVIISKDWDPIDPAEIYAVLVKDRVELRRIRSTSDSLVLLSSDGEEHIRVLPAKKPPVVGKVVVVIRARSYTVLTPGAGQE